MIKLFAIGFFLLFLLAIQYRFVSKANYLGIFIFSLMITTINCIFVKTIVWAGNYDILVYVIAAAIGCVSGTYVEKNWLSKKSCECKCRVEREKGDL